MSIVHDVGPGFQAAATTLAPVSLWPLDDVVTGKSRDVVGNRHINWGGTRPSVGAAILPGLGQPLTALRASSQGGSFVDTGLPAGATPRSVIAVIRTTAAQIQNDIVGWGTSTNNQDFAIRSDASGVFKVWVRPSEYSFTTAINDGNLHLLVVTFDGSNAIGYIDGVKAGSTQAIASVNTVLNSGNMLVWQDYYTGSCQWVGIYPRVLSANDVRWLNAVMRGA